MIVQKCQMCRSFLCHRLSEPRFEPSQRTERTFSTGSSSRNDKQQLYYFNRLLQELADSWWSTGKISCPFTSGCRALHFRTWHWNRRGSSEIWRSSLSWSLMIMISENLCEPSPILVTLGEILCEPRQLWRHGSRAHGWTRSWLYRFDILSCIIVQRHINVITRYQSNPSTCTICFLYVFSCWTITTIAVLNSIIRQRPFHMRVSFLFLCLNNAFGQYNHTFWLTANLSK